MDIFSKDRIVETIEGIVARQDEINAARESADDAAAFSEMDREAQLLRAVLEEVSNAYGRSFVSEAVENYDARQQAGLPRL